MMIQSKMHIDFDGDKFWRNPQGQRHNEDGPALIWAHGTQAWYIHGDQHRENGPAGIYTNGQKFWFINNKRVL